MAVRLSVKRVYDAPAAGDGIRVLVDRLWPRGLTKEAAKVDHWLKDLAPSNELRQWYHAAPDEWREFQRRYARELAKVPDAVATLRDLAAKRRVTLLFSSKMLEHNNATALKAFLERRDAPATRRHTT